MRKVSSQCQSIDGESIAVFAETKTAFQIRDQSMMMELEGGEKNAGGGGMQGKRRQRRRRRRRKRRMKKRKKRRVIIKKDKKKKILIKTVQSFHAERSYSVLMFH